MARGRVDGEQKKRLVTWIVVLTIVCGCLYIYPRKGGTSALEYGSKSLRKLGSSYLSGEDGGDEASNKFGEDLQDGVMLKSIPVSNFKMSKFYVHLH
jgi:hypothetical protein